MDSYDRMKPQVKSELQRFSREFWGDSKNVERFQAGAADRAMSAGCRLVRGNVALMSGFVAAEQEFHERCEKLGLPALEFVVC